MSTITTEFLMDTGKAKSLSDLNVNRVVQNVFLITLDPSNLGPQGPPFAVYLNSYGEHMDKPVFDLENVVNPFFERVLMPPKALTDSLVRNPTAHFLPRYGRPENYDVVSYLGECFIRLVSEQKLENFPGKDAVFRELEELIFRNLRLGFQEPALLEPQNLPRQFFDFYLRELVEHSKDVRLFIQKFLGEPAADFDRNAAGFALLDLTLAHVSQSHLLQMAPYEAVIPIVSAFVEHAELAKIFMAHSTPKNPRDPIACEQSLLGNLLRISCLPEDMDAPAKFFENPMRIGHAEIKKMDEFIAHTTADVTRFGFDVFNKIVRSSPELREVLLHWVGDCFSANFGRAKMWQPSVRHQIRLCSDGFILNLSAVLLRLCQPVASIVKNPTILKIHPLFPASPEYLQKLPEETTLLPKEDRAEVEMPKQFGFLSALFFLSHESLRLGWCVLWERFTKYGRVLSELEGQLEEAKATGNSAAQHEIERRITKSATRHLSLRAAITIPEHMELMIQFSVCTATWLTQMAVQPAGQPVTEVPAQFRPLFPLPTEVPPHLHFIPEVLVENVSEVMMCYARMPGNNMEWQEGWMDQLMNVALVYMSGHDRMKNPHLRAKMAMLMHNLMPRNKFADTYQEGSQSLHEVSLDSMKERLFQEHENKQQFFPAVLDVFVSIEMSGSNLRFGEAFHYRRPLYAIMEYLFQLDYHKQRVEEVAADAVTKLEQPNPPVFLRFLNLLINDATHMLGEALDYMAKLKTLENEKPTWVDLPNEQRQEKEQDFQRQGDIAKSYNVLARETAQCLMKLTAFKNPSRILLSNVMADRLAAMLNYFLRCLVDPDKRSQYKVQDLTVYKFEPKDLVLKIATIYTHLANHDARKDFLLGICRDKRSYTPELFTETLRLLEKIPGADMSMSESIRRLARDVQQTEAAENEEEELLMDEDVPDDYLDPIMSHLMRDPVLLPTSGKIVDRSTIARILLSDQSDPFNRQFLTMDLVKPADELRTEIENWIQRTRKKKKAGAP